MLEKITDQRPVIGFRAVGRKHIAVTKLTLDITAIDGHLGHFTRFHHLDKSGVRQRRLGSALFAEVTENREQDNCDHCPQKNIFCDVVQFNTPGVYFRSIVVNDCINITIVQYLLLLRLTLILDKSREVLIIHA